VSGPGTLRVVAASALIVAVVAGCAALTPAPSGPCLGELPEISNIEFNRLERVEIDVQGDVEVIRFVLDASQRGFGSVTAEPARGPFEEFMTGESVIPMGDRLTSVKFEGLVGGAHADRLREDPSSLLPVREVVRVSDRNVVRFIVGAVDGACLRLRVDPKLATVALLVSPR
jgi:hypothetical protein